MVQAFSPVEIVSQVPFCPPGQGQSLFVVQSRTHRFESFSVVRLQLSPGAQGLQFTFALYPGNSESHSPPSGIGTAQRAGPRFTAAWGAQLLRFRQYRSFAQVS